MKLKILFFPLALILCIVVFIWYIKPEFGKMRSNNANLENKGKELADLIEKEKNVSDLIANLDAQPEKEKIALGYLPQYERQEKIIDLLNFLAGESLLAVSNISVQKASPVKVISGNPEGDKAQNMNMPQLSETSASVSMAGSYENIKNYLGYIFAFGQMNSVESVSISKVSAGESEGEAGENESGSNSGAAILKADIGIKFNYMAPVVSVSGFNDPVFSRSEFDFSIVDEINKTTERGKIVPGIVVDGKGRPNPFYSP